MKRSNLVTAIDIGTTKIVVIVGEKSENGDLKILGTGETPSTGVNRGVVLNIEETVAAINKAVENANIETDISKSDVFVGIAGQHIKSIKNRGYINIQSDDEEITKKDIDKLIEDMSRMPINPGEEIVHILPQSFIVDNESDIRNPIGISGSRLEANFHIVIGKTAAANNIKRCIQRVNLNVNELILEPLASSRAVLTDDEKEVGVALVDIGGGTTDIAIFQDKIIRHSAVVPFGGNVISEDIRSSLNILKKQSEALKIQYGSALARTEDKDVHVTIPGLKGREPKEISVLTLSHIIQARMEEIFGAIYYQIELSGYADKLGAGIVLTGGGSKLKNLTQLVSYITGKETRVGLPNEYIQSDIIDGPKYSTSIGLLLMGMDKLVKEQTFNTIEEEEPVKKEIIEENIVNETIEDEIIEDIKENTEDKKSTKWKDVFGAIFKENTSTKMDD